MSPFWVVMGRWVRSQNCSCLVACFCYQLIAKPGNKTAAVPWPDPYDAVISEFLITLNIGLWYQLIEDPVNVTAKIFIMSTDQCKKDVTLVHQQWSYVFFALTHRCVMFSFISIYCRYYIQPQWVFDCVNARRQLPVEDYFQDAELPPHLSPFVEESEGDYVPPEKLKLMDPDSGR